ncbi:MAG: exosortase/archaeosortase family protein [Candidatus Omnitrophica bacterium]|nr:exosortase/archaeosortase family protein [Candidatus Omnitrophota bacterium]
MHYLVWALVTLLYAPIFKTLYQSRWEYIDYTHAYFILPVSLWLAWRKRKELKQLVAKISKRSAAPLQWNLALIILGLFMYFFGWRQDYLFISTLSLIPLAFGLTGYLYGPAVSRALAFPILYLLLLVPPPLGVLDSVTLPMRHWISVVTHQLLKTLGYPITRDGLLLSIGGKEIYMGAPCSGFRSLVTMISLGLAYVYVIKTSTKNKVILLCSVAPLALLGNLIRVVGMCLVTFYMGEAAGKGYHDASGFVIFLVLIGGMLGLEWLLGRNYNPGG